MPCRTLPGSFCRILLCALTLVLLRLICAFLLVCLTSQHHLWLSWGAECSGSPMQRRASVEQHREENTVTTFFVQMALHAIDPCRTETVACVQRCTCMCTYGDAAFSNCVRAGGVRVGWACSPSLAVCLCAMQVQMWGFRKHQKQHLLRVSLRYGSLEGMLSLGEPSMLGQSSANLFSLLVQL